MKLYSKMLTFNKVLDGISTYFHVKYSKNENGNPMQDTPATYIGTVVTEEPTAPNDYRKYQWARLEGIQGKDGEQGIPGYNGDDGETSYLHIKYSDDGKTFTSNNGETPGAWIGQYVDFEPYDSPVFSRYTWKKIEGEDGKDGKNGPMPVNSGEWDRNVEYIKDDNIQPYVWQMRNDKRHYYLLVADRSKGDDPYLNNSQGSGNIWRYNEKYDLILARKIQADEIDVDTIISRTVDSIDLGGRNLIKGTSDEPKGYNHNKYFVEIGTDVAVELDVDYTISFYVEALDNNGMGAVSVGFGKTPNTYSIDDWYKFGVISENKISDKVYKYTIKLNRWKGYFDGVHYFAFRVRRFSESTAGVSTNIWGLKMERGTIATDWTPAPEDYGELAYEDEVNLAQLGTTIIRGGHIRTELIETDSIIAKHLKTGKAGPRIEASGSELKVYGRGEHPNIIFGVNNEGYAVLAYYTGNGSLIYDLGPRGIDWGSILPASWTKVKLVETKITDINATYWDFQFFDNTDYKQGIAYYHYFAGNNPTVTDEEKEKEKYTYMKEGNFDIKIDDGWYTLEGVPEEAFAGNTNKWVKPYGERGLYQASMGVRDIPPIHVRVLMLFEKGIQVAIKYLCWNGPSQGSGVGLTNQ